MRGERRIFWLALGLAALGGAAALAHQLLWTRRLVDLLGASHESSSRVLGVFFLGLALGAAVAVKVADGWQWLGDRARLRGRWEAGLIFQPWVLLGLVELLVAGLSLPIAYLPRMTEPLWGYLGPEGFHSGAAGWVKLLVCLCVLLPPAVGMGIFLPVASRALVSTRRRFANAALVLYASNTLGGVAGLAWVTLFGLHQFGLLGSMWVTMGANGVVALGCFGLGVMNWRREVGVEGATGLAPETGVVAPEARPSKAWGKESLWMLLAMFSGAGVLAFEVLMLAILGLEVPLSFYGPSVMLALVILFLGLAAGLVALPWVRRMAGGGCLAASLVMSGVALLIGPHVFFYLVNHGWGTSQAVGLGNFVWRLLALMGLSFGPALFCVGLTFPLLTGAMGASEGFSARSWGRILGLNGVGAMLGAEVTYRFVLPWVGVYQGLGCLACIYMVVGLVVAALSLRERVGLSWVGIAAGLVGLTLYLWPGGLLLINRHLGFELVAVESGREGVVKVVSHPRIGRAILLSNQYMLGSSRARWEQERQAHLPLLMHPAPRRVGFLGVATGSTPNAVAAHGRVEEAVAVELSPVVLRMAEKHLGEVNRELFADPRVSLVVEDGRTYFAACEGEFDVLVGDLFLPWGPGEARLFSVEHFLSMRRALRDGGIFCQWLPGHQLTEEDLEIITNSYCQAFGAAHVMIRGFQSDNPSIGLVAQVGEGAASWHPFANSARVVKAACEAEREYGRLLDPTVRHAEGVELCYVERVEYDPKLPVNTLDNALIELRTGRQRIDGAGRLTYLTGVEFVRWHQRRATQGLSKRLVLAEFQRQRTQQRRMLIDDWYALPAELRADRKGDWRRWPGGLPPN